MKKSVFTLLALMLLSTSTGFAQRHGGRVAMNGNGQRMERPYGGRGDDMYGVARNGGRPMQGHHPHDMRGGHPGGYVVNHPPRVVEHVVYSAPVPPPPAPVLPPPSPRPAPLPPPPPPVHHVPAGVVAGAVIGTVIGALICH